MYVTMQYNSYVNYAVLLILYVAVPMYVYTCYVTMQ